MSACHCLKKMVMYGEEKNSLSVCSLSSSFFLLFLLPSVSRLWVVSFFNNDKRGKRRRRFHFYYTAAANFDIWKLFFLSHYFSFFSVRFFFIILWRRSFLRSFSLSLLLGVITDRIAAAINIATTFFFTTR